MNEVYILTIIKESAETRADVLTSVYRNMESALKSYIVAVDEARAEAEDYEFAHEDSEIATDTYRYFRIEDLHSNDVITIEVQATELIGEDFDNI